ncbi:bicyclogermacrene synthase-like [Salvia splendens]|uniref:bicyclogermacrene synthase-like n=1 Tax=Salvia splendens TaxID=180675 RepID=UPI001C279448|nr:bicyclogermacrene synthase-like [Salvia splendens]
MEMCPPHVSAMKNGKSLDEIRKSATFHPSIWGDFFLKYDSDSVNTNITDAEQRELAKQKEMVRKMLSQTPDDSTRKLELIDEIQRLGVEYHFTTEIEESLKYIHDSYMQQNCKDNDDLRIVALRFRLLRQQGYSVPCDVFSKFTDGEGNYEASLQNDVEGLLNLYEAAHLLTHGEGILDNAIEFCSYNLQASLHKLADVSLSKRVNEALEMPNRWSLTRLGARKFISAYQKDESHNEILLNFAKLDFNLLQKLHQRELSDATRWWKKLDVVNKMPHARDRIAELYLWVLGVFFEPCYAKARRILLKCISMASIADDTYEYATLDELRILTEAIQRWDVNETLENSPPYIQMLYRSLIKTYTEIEDEMEKTGESYRVQYAKQEMKKLLQSYFDEVIWLYNDNYIPTLEEYLKVSVVSGGYMMLSTTSLVGMGDDQVTKKDFDWIVNEPLIDRASALLARLLDDLVGDEYEEKPSSIHCYMTQYGMSEDDARAQIKQQMKNAWKDMNQECLEPTPASMPILMRVINLARAAQLIYSNGDCYTDPNKAKEWVKLLLIEAVPI